MGDFKNGTAIIVTYQAANSTTGLTIAMDVYDEAHAKDVAKSIAAMTEIGTTGRYYATFTPDAEGEWMALMEKTVDHSGKVVKAFNVVGHNVDSIGDAVATVDTVVDGIQTDLDNATDGLGALKIEIDANETKIDTVDTVVDGIQTDLSNGTDGLGALKTLINTVDTVADGLQTDLDNGTDGLGAIKTAVDAVSSPAMVG